MEEELQGVIDEIFKVLDAMDVFSQENAELASYQLNYVAQCNDPQNEIGKTKASHVYRELIDC